MNKFFLLGVMVACCSCFDRDEDGSRTTIIGISFGSSKDSLFIHKYVWGITGNHSEIIISTRKLSSKDIKYSLFELDKDLVFEYEYWMYYKAKQDTLYLWSNSKIMIPEEFDPRVKIIHVELENAQMYHMQDSIGKDGLKEIR